MTNFDFSTLNGIDLEELVCDLLNTHEKSIKSGVHYQTFKAGKDKGIDFLYSTQNYNYEVIGQVKHYLKSGWNVLKHDLKNKEKPKVLLLKPRRYILVTSLDLSIGDKELIKELFSPFILSLNDILGKKDLNKLIDAYPKVLDRHYKLWFSSTSVLNKLLRYDLEGRSHEFVDNEIQKRLRLYVDTGHLVNADKKLKKNKLIIITGEPGVGKTTLAELLAYKYINDGFDFAYIYDDVKEIEKVLRNDDSKQLFYFDDFLGHNSYEMIRAKQTESALISIMRRILRLKNKYFILTTRSFILNAAVVESERFRRFNIKAKESTIDLYDYGLDIKEKILLNHIDESNLPDEYKEILNQHSIQNFIIGHQNFSPRSVEFITTHESITDIPPESFYDFIINQFNKPDEIWRHAYEVQITDLERLMLNTFFSYGDSISLKVLENAFLARLNYEVKYNNLKKPIKPFYKTFKKLEGGFIRKESIEEDSKYGFINPSLVDFLYNYLINEKDEVIRMTESACFTTQLTNRTFPLFENGASYPLSQLLEQRLINESDSFIREYNDDRELLIIAFLIYKHSELSTKIEAVKSKLSAIKDFTFLYNNHYLAYQLVEFLNVIKELDIITLFSERYNEVFPKLIANISNIDDVLLILELGHDKFNIPLKFILQKTEEDLLSEHISQLIQYKIDNIAYSMIDNEERDIWYLEEKQREFISLKKKLVNYGFDIGLDFTSFLEIEWEDF